jgi:hypothetical protein
MISFLRQKVTFHKLISYGISKLNHNDKTLVFGLEDTQGLGASLAQWLLDKNYSSILIFMLRIRRS